MEGNVNLYDNAVGNYMSSATGLAIVNIMFSPRPEIFVRHLKCFTQTNTNDCGVYVIAVMVSILNGIDPSCITYTVSKMRDHLLRGWKINHYRFPHRKLSIIKQPPLKISGIPSFPTCRIPDYVHMVTLQQMVSPKVPKYNTITEAN